MKYCNKEHRKHILLAYVEHLLMEMLGYVANLNKVQRTQIRMLSDHNAI